MTRHDGARAFLVELYRRNRVLAVLGWLHLAAFALLPFVAPFDSRTILGLNPWVKPLKFLVSTAACVSLIFWQAMRGRTLLTLGAFVL